MFVLLFMNPQTDGVYTTVLLLIARCGMAGSYSTTWTYTSEILPTSVRATGIGFANSIGKIASVFSPWIGTTLLSFSPRIPLSIFCVLSLGAAGAAFCLPIETSSRHLAATGRDLVTDDKSNEYAMVSMEEKSHDPEKHAHAQ